MRHSLSHLYSLLTLENVPEDLPFLQQWERDLQTNFTQTQKDRILLFAHKSSVASKYEEGGYKLLTRWYQTPLVLHHRFPPISVGADGNRRGPYFTFFWECPKLNDFWDMVEQPVKEITCVSLERKPIAYLRQDTPLSNKRSKNSLLKHLLMAAKACIPALWKSPVVLTKAQWMARIREIKEMEDLMMTMKEQGEKCGRIWAPYLSYKDRSLLE